MLFSCRQPAEIPCHAQVITELTTPVYLAGTEAFAQHARYSIRCAGKCPDGMPCDSIIELTNHSMGYSIRRVRCGCKGQPVDRDCGIMIERTRYSADTIITRLFCNGIQHCPVESDTCLARQQMLPGDTIRSRINGRDSIILVRTITTCECNGN